MSCNFCIKFATISFQYSYNGLNPVLCVVVCCVSATCMRMCCYQETCFLDYEKMVDEDGVRLVAFGKMAGEAGAVILSWI